MRTIFGNGSGADVDTEIAVLGRNFLEKQKIYLSYPKSTVWVGCFSIFRCTMSL